MKTPVYIYGAGGLGREILSFLKDSDLWEPAGFLDDAIVPGTTMKSLRMIGGFEAVAALPKPAHLILALGDPEVKQKVCKRLANIPDLSFPVLIHPSAILQDQEYIRVGAGSIIMAGCIMTTDIQIGKHVLVNLNCTLGHNTEVGDYSSIMPGANLAGQVKIGETVLVGSGANILNGIKVGDRSKVGAGAVVTKDVAQDAIVVGIPARRK